MSDKLIKKLDDISTYKVDKENNSILNLNSVYSLNRNDFYEIINILETSRSKYGIDSKLNFLLL